METKTVLTSKQFLQYYMAAYKAGWNRAQLADYLGISPNTVYNRSLIIKKEMGNNVPLLKLGPNDPVSDSKMKKFNEYLKSVEEKEIDVSALKSDSSKNWKPGIYVITSAQNSTPVNMKFFNTIMKYVEVRKAKLLVVPFRYKNPTSVFSRLQEEDETWASVITPYLIDKTIKLAPNLVVVSDLKIQPTATSPLSSLEGLTGNNSVIFGTPKIELKTVATSDSSTKIMTTTGAITVPNYTDSKAGFKGKFHYNLAATIVEVDSDGDFFIRHIHAKDDGSFYDLDCLYKQNEVVKNNRIEALITGDTHALFIDPSVEKATYSGVNSICKLLKPKYKVYHDVNDFFSRNHHSINDPLMNYAKHLSGLGDVERELQATADLIDRNTTDDSINVIVKSNHDEALDRWLKESDPSKDAENSRLYHYLNYHLRKNMKITPTGYSTIDPFEFWCKNPDKFKGLKNIERTKFLKRNESFSVKGIELAFHGDKGPNGSHGSIKQFTKVGPKCIIGHSHSPGIYESVYQVGTSSRLDLSYVSGPSSWSHTHAIIYPDGSRTLIHIVNGKWKI